MKTSLLIDGDEYLFKACAAVEREVRWDDWNHVLYTNLHEAWQNFVRMIDQLWTRFETVEHALCFSAPPNFRYSVAEDYKAGREKSRKPLCYADLREKCGDQYNTIFMPGLEADDVMGILATKPGDRRYQRIIISQDKDMKTIPCQLLREGEVITVTEAEADYNHLYQTLTGDITDGYKGLPGCGPKKAELVLTKSIRDNDTPWERVVAAYAKAGMSEEHALKQARLARILRWSDWDTVAKVPILWTP
jgi:DNA polymerase-1